MGARFLLSPHLDDAVLSCGGLIARWINRGYDVTVLTIFAGDPPPGPLSPFAQELHSRWDQADGAVASRRAEDRIACGRLGASVAHLAFPDALYRRSAAGDPLYPNEALGFWWNPTGRRPPGGGHLRRALPGSRGGVPPGYAPSGLEGT